METLGEGEGSALWQVMENSENITALFVQSRIQGLREEQRPLSLFVGINIAEKTFEDKS